MRTNFFIIFLFSSVSLFSQENENTVVIRDSGLYNINFIKYWDYLKEYDVLITNDSIIVSGNKANTIIIPTDIPLKQDVKYKAVNGDTTYILTVTRLNYTDIQFSIIGTCNNINVFERKDLAVLESSFYLGSEGVYEKNEEEIFRMNDYNISNHGDHKLLIPFGTIEVINYYEPLKSGKLVLFFKKIE